jgi:hypothetical protein
MTEIKLFVQEGCRPCMYAETQLKKVEGWEDVVTIIDAKQNGVWSQLARDCGVDVTPTLIAMIDGVIVAKLTGSKQMTSEFWQNTINKHKANVNT